MEKSTIQRPIQKKSRKLSKREKEKGTKKENTKENIQKMKLENPREKYIRYVKTKGINLRKRRKE